MISASYNSLGNNTLIPRQMLKCRLFAPCCEHSKCQRKPFPPLELGQGTRLSKHGISFPVLLATLQNRTVVHTVNPVGLT